MKNKSLKVIFALSLYSAIFHLPDDINAVGKAIKDYNRENTFNQAFRAAAASGSLKSLDESGCSEANSIYASVLSDPHYKLFKGAVQQTGEQFYNACKPLIK